MMDRVREKCRHCGKDIELLIPIDYWSHVSIINGSKQYRKYCNNVRDNPKTSDINKTAEPFTKNEIIYRIIQEL